MAFGLIEGELCPKVHSLLVDSLTKIIKRYFSQADSVILFCTVPGCGHLPRPVVRAMTAS
jgi:hypothetical protein